MTQPFEARIYRNFSLVQYRKNVCFLISSRGRTAIITSGSGGLGAAMTVALAEAGADIVSLQLLNNPLSDSLKEFIESL